jgi:hypothetical protein
MKLFLDKSMSLLYWVFAHSKILEKLFSKQTKMNDVQDSMSAKKPECIHFSCNAFLLNKSFKKNILTVLFPINIFLNVFKRNGNSSGNILRTITIITTCII